MPHPARARLLPAMLVTALLLTGPSCSPYEPLDLPDDLFASSGYGIIGGMSTADWPAVGAYLIDGGYGGMCTATLVHPEVLLTAAHCTDTSGSDDMFYVGSNVNNATWNDIYTISSAIEHPSYNPNSYHPHDIAVLLLDDPIHSIDIIPVNTTSFDNSWVGKWFHYVGFGSDSHYGGSGSGIKRETDIQVYEYYNYEYIHYTVGTNTCSGDSGGPGMVEIDGDWYVAGVNSSVFSQSGDPCTNGGGYEMRADAELNFLDDYFDPYETAPPDDDDDDASDDDDFVGDDDDTMPPIEELPAPHIDEDEYDQPEGCACSSRRATRSPWAVALVLGLAGLLWRRR